MKRGFDRSAFYKKDPELLVKGLSGGRRANADLFYFHSGEGEWVLKDFSPCPPLIRKTWGCLAIQREYETLLRLQGIKGVPADPFRLDAYAMGYRFVPGRNLRDVVNDDIPDDFFPLLEKTVMQMHDRNIVHLDVRNHRNVLVQAGGNPVLLDFQTGLNLRRVPRYLRQLLKDIDLSGVYKLWKKRRPELFDRHRMKHLEAVNRKRTAWFLQGYPMGIGKNKK